MKTRVYQPLRPGRFLVLSLVIVIMTLAGVDFSAKASEMANADQSGSAGTPEEALSDYHLSPGDHITLVVLDHKQLSGDFIIDGGGGILLPVAGSVRLSGLTLAEAQKVIQDRFADGVLVEPTVSLRITSYKPIFVTGRVRKPGSYTFFFGESVKAAIATAGGKGLPLDQPESVAVSDFITAQEHMRQLEAEQTTLRIRKARLEAQRDGREDFLMPLPIGLNHDSVVDVDRVYSAESDTFSRLEAAYRGQVESLQEQRPRVQSELKAVNDQIGKQKERLGIVNDHLADLEQLFKKGLLRKDVLLNQQIERALVEAQASNLEAQVAHLQQTMGNINVTLRGLRATFERQTLEELQGVSQRLRTVEASIGPARRMLAVKAEAASDNADEEQEYTILVSRVGDGHTVTFQATEDTTLLPGDVVEVKMKRQVPGDGLQTGTQAMRSLKSGGAVADSSESASQ